MVLPPGEAIVKSATGFKVPGQVTHVEFESAGAIICKVRIRGKV